MSGDGGKISEMINSLAYDVRNLLMAALEISYFSRAAWPYDLVLQMSPLERDLAIEFINKRLEVAKKSMHPIY